MYALLIAAASLGIDAGWQPLPEGGLEYIVQIEPQMLETMSSALIEDNVSDIPPDLLSSVRKIRITFGTQALPREGLAKPAPAAVSPPTAASPPATIPPPASQADAAPELDPANEPPAQPTFRSEPNALAGMTTAEHAVFNRPIGDAAGTDVADAGQAAGPSSESKPWLPLLAALAVATGSFFGMLYFAWIAYDYRSRYRDAMHKLLTLGFRPGEMPAA